MQLLKFYDNLRPDEWKYYEALNLQEKDDVISCFNATHCEKFIKSNFACGAKEKAFDLSFFENYLKNGKHEHTVSLYFLGCCFKEIVNTSLQNYLNKNISKVEEWYDFRYTWYLTCLYHDIASSIEQTSWSPGCSSDLDFYLGKENVQFNVFEHNWNNIFNKPYTYAEKLVKNYFKYRVEYWHSIDHGIIAGFVLYDRLIKNYNDNWETYLSENRNTASSKENFDYNHLKWRKEHLSHFAIVADAIIAHNIWLSGTDDDKIKLYKQFGLDPLISHPDNSGRLTLESNPLIFFLDLLDTIEPVKYFTKHSPKKVLESVEISKQDNRFVIHVPRNLPEYNGWHDKVMSVKDWLDVATSTNKNDENALEISITVSF